MHPHAASSCTGEERFERASMLRQERKACSTMGLESSRRTMAFPVSGPTLPAQLSKRSRDHGDSCRWLSGMCSAKVEY